MKREHRSGPAPDQRRPPPARRRAAPAPAAAAAPAPGPPADRAWDRLELANLRKTLAALPAGAGWTALHEHAAALERVLARASARA